MSRAITTPQASAIHYTKGGVQTLPDACWYDGHIGHTNTARRHHGSMWKANMLPIYARGVSADDSVMGSAAKRRLLYDVRATWDRGFADPKFNPHLLPDETFGGFPFRSFAICQADRRTHSRTPFPRTDDRCLLTTSASTLLSRLYDVLRFTSRWTMQDTTSHQRPCLVRD